MSRLKNENLNKCFSLLREYVEESTAEDNKKGTAILTLNQLQKIIAGTDGEGEVMILSCNGRPIADRS
jgi:hypothetical protein